MNEAEIIIELLNALEETSDDPDDDAIYAIERAERYLFSKGYRRDGLTGESWLKS